MIKQALLDLSQLPWMSLDGKASIPDMPGIYFAIDGTGPTKMKIWTNLPTGFTRQETIALSGENSGNLNYLDDIGIISPQRFGNPKRPKVIYSVEQIIKLKIIAMLRDRLSFREACKVAQFIRDRNYSQYLFNSLLVVINGELFSITSWESFGLKVLATAADNKGRVEIREVGRIGDAIAEIKQAGIAAQILDFEKRIEGTVLIEN
jgi:hypothetical protein